MPRKSILFSLFFMSSILSIAQTKEDSVRYMMDYSKKYLSALFIQKDPDSAIRFWGNYIYNDLKVGYDNGEINYKTNADLEILFTIDFLNFIRKIPSPIEFLPADSLSFFEEYENIRYFSSFFFIKDSVIKAAEYLNWIGLDFISRDRGKTWEISQDHWIANFMYYLYRFNKPPAHFRKKIF